MTYKLVNLLEHHWIYGKGRLFRFCSKHGEFEELGASGEYQEAVRAKR